MDSIGVQLKNARTRKGLSIEEVNQITRVPVRMLQAIESDDLGAMDSAFFYRSFVKQYARTVGVQPSDLEGLLPAACQQIPEPQVPGQIAGQNRPDLPGLASKRGNKLRWVFSMFSLFFLLGVCSQFYEFWQNSRAVPEPMIKSSAASQPATQGQSGATPSPAAADVVRVKLSALENTWLSVATDGKEVFKGTLRADESTTLEGRETARVRTENAGGVEVVFNGRSLGKLGPEGQIRTVVFTKDSYNVLQPAAMPLATILRIAE